MQAKGDSGKEPQLPLWQNGEKKTLGENGLSRGGQFSSGQAIIVLIKILNVLYCCNF